MTELVVPAPDDSVEQGEAALEAWAANNFADEPFTKLVGFVAVGSWLFYKAEVGHNDKVTTIYDAFVYVSTCLSVGYGDIFAKTPAGKVIGSFIMTVGPAMANAAFAGSSQAKDKEKEHDRATQEAILATMKEILVELKKR